MEGYFKEIITINVMVPRYIKTPSPHALLFTKSIQAQSSYS